MAKLTLSVDERIVERAKAYALAQGTSVSGLVEKLLDLVATPTGKTGDAPAVLSKLRGSLKRGSSADYHRYLARKYR
ncbi:MAG: DUF6364 family protein [Vicinamibacterales bacterium]|jgi:hypothetical protein